MSISGVDWQIKMAKKKWYSTPLKFYWNDLYSTQKKITPYFTDQQIFAALRHNLLKAPLAESESLESRDLMLAGLEMWREDLDKELLHIFFIDKHLKDFLEDIPLSDLNGIKRFLYENGESKKIIYFKAKSHKNCVAYSFGLHVPYETNGYAFSFSIDEDETLELYYSYGTHNGALTDKFYSELIKSEDKKSIFLANAFRLAINTIAYMKCFPECVIDGVPRITIERDERRSDKNITFSISDKVSEIEKSDQSKIPHFRRGFFRSLKSDFYTHKKDQLVFVHETMVKGRARTISTSKKIDEIDRLDEN
jgi:hypothetical protein